jgi:DtxR family Mn-dependent transcriptional regulator
MVNPVMALFVAFIFALIIGVIFWPNTGLLARHKKNKQSDKRILMEDALKNIYDITSRNIPCDINALAHILKCNIQVLEKIVENLRSLGLIHAGTQFKLTAEGKDYALRLLRIHRLWERYLAEETSVPESDWHREAEIQEHKITLDQANELSRSLGYPRYDPHGDPIPTKSGDLPPERGRSLFDFSQGDVVRVVHIEDEPPDLYDEIVNKGIYLENHIEILKKLEKSIHILTNGESQTLSARIAKNITAIISQEDENIEEPFQNLSSFGRGDKAEVIKISKACRGTQRRRLMDLGVVPGTVITIEMQSAGGDPTAYNIRGAIIALRKDQAEMVMVRPLNEEHENVN